MSSLKSKRKSRTSIFIGTAASTAVYQAAIILTGFIVPRIIIAQYGSDVNGLVNSLTQIINYFSIVEAGISGAAVVMMYRPLSSEDWPAVSKIATAAKLFYIKSGVAFTALVVLLAVLYPLFGSVGFLGPIEIAVLVLALGAKGFLDFFTLSKYRVLLTADRRTWVIQIASAFYQVLNAMIIYMLATMGASVVVTYAVALVAIFSRTIILVAYTKKHYAQVSYNADCTGIKLEQRWDALFLQILGVIQQGAPVIIATIVLGDYKLVSVFSIYLLIANGIQQIPNFLATGLQASFGELLAKGEFEKLKRAYAEYELLTYFVVSVVCACGFVLIMPFVGLYMGSISDQNYFYPTLGFLCILNVALYHGKSPQGLMVVAAGLYRDTRWRTLIQATILIVVAAAAGVLFGMEGVFVGMCASNLYRLIDLIFFIPRRVIKCSPWASIKRLSVNVLALVVSVVLLSHIVLGAGSSWSSWLFWAAVCSLACVAVTLFLNIAFNGAETIRIFRRLRKR